MNLIEGVFRFILTLDRRVRFRCLQARDVGGAVVSVPGQIRERNVMADKTMEDDTRLLFWLKHSCIFK